MRTLLRTLIRLLFNLIARVEVNGYEHLPAQGNFVIATNHLGIVDAPLAFYALDRWDLFVLVGEKWEKNRFLKWLGKYFNFVFIDRFHPDIKTLRKVMALMDEGKTWSSPPRGRAAGPVH